MYTLPRPEMCPECENQTLLDPCILFSPVTFSPSGRVPKIALFCGHDTSAQGLNLNYGTDRIDPVLRNLGYESGQ